MFHSIQYIIQCINYTFRWIILTIDACPKSKKIVIVKAFLFDMYKFT